MIRKDLLKIIACPICNSSDLKLNTEKIRCLNCQKIFEVENNIPKMIEKSLIISFTENRKLKIESNLLLKRLKPPSPSLNISNKIKNLLDENKMILDLGSGERRLAKSVINLDIFPNPNVDIVGNADTLPFKDGVFDVVICQAVLEHVGNPKKVAGEIYRVLKKDGLIYAEIPFLQGFHPDPADYQRYTIQGIEHLFADFKKIESGVAVGPSSTLSWFLRKYPSLFFNNKHLSRGMEFIFGWITFPIKYLDYFLLKTKRQKIAYLAGGFFFLGKK